MKTRVLFLVTEDWYFVSHRVRFARKLVESGYHVAVGCRVSKMRETIEGLGIEVYDIPFAREKLSPAAILRACSSVRLLIREWKPSIVHLVALRPILVGWMATLGLRRPLFINAVTGMGSLFSGDLPTLRLKLVRSVVSLMFRRVFRQETAENIWQNRADFERFTSCGLAPMNRTHLISGVGIDYEGAQYATEKLRKKPVVLFVGRLLRDKGIFELLEACKALDEDGIDFELRIIGEPDGCNPGSLTESEQQSWDEFSWVRWLGRRRDVVSQMRESNLIAMPSYREGLPQVLLEAGLAGRAVVTTDVPGCQDVVRNGENGMLVPAGEVEPLKMAIRRLLVDSDLRQRYAHNNYRRVERLFSEKVVFQNLMDLYQTLETLL